MVLPEAHASEGKPLSSPGRSRFTESLAPLPTQNNILLTHAPPHFTSKLDSGDHRPVIAGVAPLAPPSSLGGVVPIGPAMMDPSPPPLTFLSARRPFFLQGV